MAETVSVPEDAEERASRVLLESLVQLRAFNELASRNRSAARRTVPVPAAESSIQALEKMICVEEEIGDERGSSSTIDCSICMEKFRTGSLLNRMPCSHLFHQNCIVQWLNVNHTCPYCRFTLPTR